MSNQGVGISSTSVHVQVGIGHFQNLKHVQLSLRSLPLPGFRASNESLIVRLADGVLCPIGPRSPDPAASRGFLTRQPIEAWVAIARSLEAAWLPATERGSRVVAISPCMIHKC